VSLNPSYRIRAVASLTGVGAISSDDTNVAPFGINGEEHMKNITSMLGIDKITREI
jgi:hypothetical protein